MIKLIGDNPFQGVSHVSMERAIIRGDNLNNPIYCANLILESNADGFFFTLNDRTFPILKRLAIVKKVNLYPLVPDVASFVKNGNGAIGIAKNIIRDMILTNNFSGIARGITGVITQNPSLLFQSYLDYELSRIKLISDGEVKILFLHEVLTDMVLALGMDWLFLAHLEYCKRKRIRCGFETRNFTSLVNKLSSLALTDNITIATPFNPIGFQMCPSREENEKSLLEVSGRMEVIAFSILAGGYIKLNEAIDYIKKLSLVGVGVGVSNVAQMKETFTRLGEI